jgi:hypothetical protein
MSDMEKTLDKKLAEIHADANSKAFIIADAKDADMAFGIAAPGQSPEHVDGGFRSLSEYRDHIRENIRQGLVDIMLMSVSTAEMVALNERMFDRSGVTPAIRANDTSDVWAARGGAYIKQPSKPFRSALLDHAQCGRIADENCDRRKGVDLGLYSITFNNDLAIDHEALEVYKTFREEAEVKGFRHFLELFDPNAPINPIPPNKIGPFINDLVARTLAGVATPGRPIFLKMVYHGPKWMEELAAYDRHLVPGILGGSAGTTYDAFKLLAEAQKYGARAALFGRKINNAEHQLSFIQFLRWIADGVVQPEEAVKAYHGVLQEMGIKPWRPLQQDMMLTSGATSYGGSGTTISLPSSSSAPQRASAPAKTGQGQPPVSERPTPTNADGQPDFSKMSAAERLAYHQQRLDKMFGD